MRRHLLSIDDLSRDDIERILGRAESFAEVSGREIKKVPDAARAHGHQPLLRGLHAHQLELRAGREAALSADLVNVKSIGLERWTRASRSRTPCRRCPPTTRPRS